MKQRVKKILSKLPGASQFKFGKDMYRRYGKFNTVKVCRFIGDNWRRIYLVPYASNKAEQICNLIKKVNIAPVDSELFFYSIDCFKSIEHKNPMLINYTANYDTIVNSSFNDISLNLKNKRTEFSIEENEIIKVLRTYTNRCRETRGITDKYEKQLEAIESLFMRPSETLFEALQRILFFNQILWQTKHQHNGFGRLDVILNDVYLREKNKGEITREQAECMIKEFMRILHEYYWYKSGLMLGDTGQIIIVGGKNEDNDFFCNDLTYIFIEAMMELQLPEPKVLLRSSSTMPDELLRLSLNSIATGIGAPLLTNDDYVIPNLIDFGYDKEDSYNYSASACWEPLITNNSCDLNNIKSFNFAEPLVRMLDSNQAMNVISFKEFENSYYSFLATYVKETLEDLTTLTFEEDPILSLVSTSAISNGCDLTAGGAKYYNLGLTSVGIGTVVNSFLNVKKLVFEENKISLVKLNKARKDNFSEQEELLTELKNISPCYGQDDECVIELTNRIMRMASIEFDKYVTTYNGKFKFGLSSPYYIEDANSTMATLDGRKDRDPFNVHISASGPLPITSLFRFASKLDYSNNKFNGNVVDFIITPNFIRSNLDKLLLLIKTGIREGLYQIQINVVDSKTLIAAKCDPSLFPNLIVRVWGFSAYFNDLPEEYKDVLINRAIESENAA